jgi:D-alanyl-D-alanine carboxypeptidase (penicillin-binding protein 5/6)
MTKPMIKPHTHIFTACLAMVMLMFASVNAHAIETDADYALLMDAQSGVVLFEKNADARMSPASMSKLMTVLMAFEGLENGDLTEDDKFFVSDDAWRRGGASSGGSTMFLKARSRVSVIDLLRGVIIQSGNDACIALAEGIAGSEESFANMMTERAAELGMSKSTFVNATGLPHPEHKMSARDLALLSQELINKHSNYYGLFAERDFTWNKIRQRNRNPLLSARLGADGLKTGHTEESGYGLVASAEQNGRRLILVLNGLTSKNQRASEARKMMTWGFRSFKNETLVSANETVATLPVWHGSEDGVRVGPVKRFDVVTPKGGGLRKMVATMIYEKPILAPIKTGDVVATMRVTMPGLAPQEVELVAQNDIERGNFISRALSSLGYLIMGGE